MRVYIILGTFMLFSCSGPGGGSHAETTQDSGDLNPATPDGDGETSADVVPELTAPDPAEVETDADAAETEKTCSPKCGPCRSCDDGVCVPDGSCLPCAEGCRDCELCVQGYCIPTDECRCSDEPFPHDACAEQCGELDACERCICDDPSGDCVVWSRLGTGCCLEDADCDDHDVTTSEFCPSPGASCVYDCVSCHCSLAVNTVFFTADFDQNGLAPFEHAPGVDPDEAVGWRVGSYDAHSGAFSLYFGDPSCMTYYTGACPIPTITPGPGGIGSAS
jgi:hypothetical protein